MAKSKFDKKIEEKEDTMTEEIPTEKVSPQTEEVYPSGADEKEEKQDNRRPEKIQNLKSVLSQPVSATVASPREGSGGVIPNSGIGGTNHSSYSGNEGTIAGSSAGTSIQDKPYRSSSRQGKKTDSAAYKVDSTISEQVVIGMEESKPLHQSSEEVQGYNGNYRNETMRLQKNQGHIPGSVRFARSLDEASRDMMYFGTGQIIKQDIPEYKDYPTQTSYVEDGDWKFVNYDVNGELESNYSLNRGNYLPRALHFTIEADKSVSAFNFTVDDLSTTEENADVVNASATHELTSLNKTELQREMMDSKAGDETDAGWSPLGRAITQPSRTLSLLKDIEQDTGNVMYTSIRRAMHSLSYQINKSRKDGNHEHRPIKEMLTHNFFGSPDSSYAASDTIFDDYQNRTSDNTKAMVQNGSNWMFQALFDSPAKYNTKADFLLQPRTWKMHVLNAVSKLGIYRMNNDYRKAIESTDVFSTIDKEYDPTSPVYMNDFINVTSPFDWNELYSFEALSGGKPVFTQKPFKYGYSDQRNKYVTTAAHPLLKGIHQFVKQFASKLYRMGKTDENDAVSFTIPINYSMRSPSTWALLVLASVQYIEQARIDSMRDVLDYETSHEYPFTDLSKMSEIDFTYSKNFNFTNILDPLKIGRMDKFTALSWKFPEYYTVMDEATDMKESEVMLPWYFNEKQFDLDVFNPNNCVMSYPSSRDGVRFGPLDSVYEVSERDLRLSLDRLTTIPKSLDVARTTDTVGFYSYDQTSDALPIVSHTGGISIGEYLKTPRELGLFAVTPYGYLSPQYYNEGLSASTMTTVNLTDYVADLGQFHLATDFYENFESSYKVRYYYGPRDADEFFNHVGEDKLMSDTEINVNRGLNFSQWWNEISTAKISYDGSSSTNEGDGDPGFVLSLSDLYTNGQPVEGKSVFTPINVYTAGVLGQSEDAKHKLVTLQKYFWTRLEKLSFVFNPFDVGMSYVSIGEDSSGFDPFDMLYFFNLAGFRASDFNQDVQDKVLQIDRNKIQYTKDYFTEASPLFK